MAVKRTGTIYAAKKLRTKKISALLRGDSPANGEPDGAPGFFGSFKKESPLGRIILIFQLIGKPFFWAILLGLFVISYSSLVTGNLLLYFVKLTGYFPKKIASSLIKFAFGLKLPKLKPSRLKLLLLKPIKIEIRWRPGKKSFIFFSIFGLLVTGYWLLVYLIKDLPDPNRLITRQQIVSTKIYDRHGELLYKIYRNQNRTLIPLTKIPLPMIQATIAIEDAEFYQHRGFSLKGIIRAFLQNLKGGKLYGGSTITQQLVKNALLTPERTIKRKIKEIILALWVEQKFSKEEILQMYFNEVGYGGAASGIEEASQMYFGKSVRNLNLAEAALLAGLPASPTTYSPFGAHPEKAKERQALVLQRMTEENFLTPNETEKTRRQELHFAPQRTDIKAPHFVMYIKELLVEKYGLRLVEEGGLKVITSLDLDLQEQTQAIVRQEVDQLQRLHITNGAALVTKPATGEILAMVGSRDYFDLENDGNVNVTLRPRQPGSAIKPVNYSVALENGFTPATIIPDTPVTYQVPGQPPYSPKNYDGRFHGNIPLRVALASSYNVPAVKVLSSLGVKKMIKRGQEMGITTWDEPSRFGLSLTLGGGEVKMIDLAVVYGILANLGNRVDLNPILEVKDYEGQTLEKLEIEPTKVLTPQVAYILTNILSDNTARTPAFGPSSVLNLPGHPHVAVKTGTTQNMRDNWTIGYTPDYVVAVWVGNNDNTPMSYVASGITGASPIWNKIMSLLLKDIPDKQFPQPEDLSRVKICLSTGTLPCEGCPGQWEYFLPGTEPKVHCLPKEKEEKEEEQEKVTSDRAKPSRELQLHIINYQR